MLVQLPFDGQAVRVSPRGEGYRGPLPTATVEARRALLARSLAVLGLSGVQTGQILGLSPSRTCEVLKAAEAEAEIESYQPEPAESPPVIPQPAPYRRPPVVDVSARFVASMRREYLKDGDGRTRRIGQLEDVAAWLASLEPGKMCPRRSSP